MFTSVKNKMKRDKLIRLLGFLVSATTAIPEGHTTPVGFGLVPEKDAKELVSFEPTFASINPGAPPDSDGRVQVAALTAGIEAWKASQVPAASNPAGTGSTSGAVVETAQFTISSDVVLPAIQRGGGMRESKYPFAQLELIAGKEYGQSFFVPNTDAKKFASTITGQNRKYKGERRFTIRKVTENNVTGIRVWRVAPKAAASK